MRPETDSLSLSRPGPAGAVLAALTGETPFPQPLEIQGRRVVLTLCRHPRAQTVSLRLDAARDALVLVAPPHVPERALRDFVVSRADWVQRQVATLPERIPFAEGAVLPLRGRPHRVVHRPTARRGIWVEEGVILVSGRAEHLPRRLGDWLRVEARRTLTAQIARHAATLERPVARVTIRDTRSRWGSCAAGGQISVSWRLILAPESVLDYVAAHEVAHLVEFNHSPRFWDLVRRLHGAFDSDRAWLRDQGHTLHRYG